MIPATQSSCVSYAWLSNTRFVWWAVQCCSTSWFFATSVYQPIQWQLTISSLYFPFEHWQDSVAISSSVISSFYGSSFWCLGSQSRATKAHWCHSPLVATVTTFGDLWHIIVSRKQTSRYSSCQYHLFFMDISLTSIGRYIKLNANLNCWQILKLSPFAKLYSWWGENLQWTLSSSVFTGSADNSSCSPCTLLAISKW